ncbi:hypothetical protein [Kribbella sp. NPDC049227]|uniref:hypothetical protein n=1 Tax=Kribbella sp. NPDC049227 TaxID=3364113 RepID=UPI003718E28D
MQGGLQNKVDRLSTAFDAVLIGIGVFRYWKLRVGNAADRAAAVDKAARLRERCATVTDQLATYTNAAADRQAAITQDVAELRRRLIA